MTDERAVPGADDGGAAREVPAEWGEEGDARRVLQLLATSGGGVGRHVGDLAAGLRAAGVAVAVAGPAETDERFGYRAAGLPFTPVDVADRPRPAADARALARLRSLARYSDVVHAHGLRAGAFAVLAARALPARHRPAVVVTLHNALVSGPALPPARTNRATTATALVHQALERVVARADAVLVVSADLGAAMTARGARDVRRALVPAPPLPPATRPAGQVRAALGVPDGTALLVTVARLAPQKGLDTLVDAVRLLAGGPGRPVHAVVAGDGPLEPSLRERARGLPLTLLGRRDDVADLLAAADVVVVPSRWEGQPLVVQEALRAGAVLVATDAGGTADVAGDAATLVRPGEPAALAAAVREALEPATAARLRAAAVRQADRLPSAADAVRQVNDIYSAVTGGGLLPGQGAGG